MTTWFSYLTHSLQCPHLTNTFYLVKNPHQFPTMSDHKCGKGQHNICTLIAVELSVPVSYSGCQIDLHRLAISSMHLLSPAHWFHGVGTFSFIMHLVWLLPRYSFMYFLAWQWLGIWNCYLHAPALLQLLFIPRTLYCCYHCQDDNIISLVYIDVPVMAQRVQFSA